mmetsp:Transcript_19072/g.41091  ORF Transcript_19072/g.41091 Transcript_19072/m.41091 type:complete len:319 (+) Transcript_19072:119-1075(+)
MQLHTSDFRKTTPFVRSRRHSVIRSSSSRQGQSKSDELHPHACRPKTQDIAHQPGPVPVPQAVMRKVSLRQAVDCLHEKKIATRTAAERQEATCTNHNDNNNNNNNDDSHVSIGSVYTPRRPSKSQSARGHGTPSTSASTPVRLEGSSTSTSLGQSPSCCPHCEVQLLRLKNEVSALQEAVLTWKAIARGKGDYQQQQQQQQEQQQQQPQQGRPGRQQAWASPLQAQTAPTSPDRSRLAREAAWVPTDEAPIGGDHWAMLNERLRALERTHRSVSPLPDFDMDMSRPNVPLLPHFDRPRVDLHRWNRQLSDAQQLARS